MLIAVLSASISASAYDFEVDGIYYNIISLDDLTCEVTYNAGNKSTNKLKFYTNYHLNYSYPSYTGNVTIPPTVNYKGRVLSVTGIGEYAFLNCTGLSSLSLPSSITQIKEVLFYYSEKLHAGAFDYCNIETFTAGNAYTLEMFNRSYASSYKTKDKLKNLVLSNDFFGAISVNFSDYKKLVSIRSNVMNVPSFSEGDHFSNEQFLNTEVWVPEEAFSEYQSSNVWKDFWELKPMKSVKSITLREVL